MGVAWTRAAAPAVGLLACLLYWPIRGHEWLSWDDFTYITQNPFIAHGLSIEGLNWAFSNFYLANWFPLTWLSWMLDFELYGFEASGFLTTNLLLHAANSALLCAALTRMTGAPGRSAFVAAVFAVHPLHVESVAWAAARKDVLCGLFWMLALWFHGGSGPAGRRRLAVAGCYALAFAAKPTALTLPFVLLFLDDWPLARTRAADDPTRLSAAKLRAALIDKAPLFVLFAIFALVTFFAQRSGGVVQELEALPVGMRLSNATISYIAYLGDFLWPSGLAFFYPHPGGSIPGWQVAGAGLLLVGWLLGALSMRRTRPSFLVGGLWFLVTLLPVIGLVQVGAQARADRYMYLPLIGVAITVAWALPEPIGRRFGRSAVVGVAGLIVLALSLQTTRQIPYWRDSVSLFERALQVTQRNYVAHAQLGGTLIRLGRTDEAIEHYDAALQIIPDYMWVANNLAWLLATSERASLRDPARALELANLAVSLSDPASPDLLDTLAAAQASARKFGKASATAKYAVRLAREAGDAALAADIAQRLALYRARLPYREERGVPGGDPSDGAVAP